MTDRENIEQQLTEWAANNARRDDLVRAALLAGVTANRIHTLTGIARTTIYRIKETPMADYWKTPPSEAHNDEEQLRLVIAQLKETSTVRLDDEVIESLIRWPRHDSFELKSVIQWTEWSPDGEQGHDRREVIFMRTQDERKWATGGFFRDAQWQYGDLIPVNMDD